MTLRIRIKLTMTNVISHNTANINVLKHIIVCDLAPRAADDATVAG